MSAVKPDQPAITVNLNEPMFEVISPNGQVWMAYFNGKTSGFPPGAKVVNHSLQRVNLLIGSYISKASPSPMAIAGDNLAGDEHGEPMRVNLERHGIDSGFR